MTSSSVPTPTPSPQQLAEYSRFVDGFIDPQNTLDLVVDRTRLMILKETPEKTQIADESIVSLLQVTPRQLSLQGKKVGTTVLNLYLRDPKDKSEKILSYLVRVIPDPEARRRLEQSYKALEEEINALTRQCTVADLVERLNRAGVPSGPVYDIGQAFEDPQAKHLRMTRPAPHAALGELQLLRSPINLSACPHPEAFTRAAPDAGEHTDEVLRELGYDAEAVARLRGEGAVA